MEYIYGSDILDSDARIIAHVCNCTTKGSAKGVANAIFDRYPYADVYKRRKNNDTPGRIRLCGGKNEKKIVNMFAQKYPGKPNETDDTYELRKKWFEECLMRISTIKNLRSIAFPCRIGCGLAGGEWSDYQTMLESWSNDNPTVSIQIVSNEDEEEYQYVEVEMEEEVEWECVQVKAPFWPKAMHQICDNFSSHRCWYWDHIMELHTITSKYISNADKSQTLCDRCYAKYNCAEEVTSGESEPSDAESLHSEDTESDDEDYSWETSNIIEYTEMNIPAGWEEFFEGVLDDGKLNDVNKVILADVEAGNEIYPPIEKVYKAFEMCGPEEIKVIIIGQDPYHGYGQAQGLSFSVPTDAKAPSSLQNIFKEIEAQGYTTNSNDLTKWTEQGVFLINTALTVKASTPESHTSQWADFTTYLLSYISRKCNNVVIILWGMKAKNLCAKLFNDPNKFLKLHSPHPSGLSVHRGFFGCHHFTKANEWLYEKGLEAIDWDL
jgi:uracil-DNA glycosylase